MAKFPGVDIPKVVFNAMKKLGAPSYTLRKIASGALDTNNPTAGLPATPTDYPCRGLPPLRYEESDIDGTTVMKTDQRIKLFGASLPTGIAPTEGDQIKVDNVWRRVLEVTHDPVKATYNLQVR